MNYLFLIITIVLVLAILFVASFTKLRLTNEGYDRLKWLVMRWYFLVTFIGVLVSTFKFDYGEETITVVAAIGALLAGMLGISKLNYKDGAAADPNDGGGIDEISDDYYVDAYELEDGEDESGGEDENEDIQTV